MEAVACSAADIDLESITEEALREGVKVPWLLDPRVNDSRAERHSEYVRYTPELG